MEHLDLQQQRRNLTSGSLLGAAGLLLCSQAANAQLAPAFADILNGDNGVAEQCADGAEGTNLNIACDAYAITPTTDLQMRLAAPEELAAQKSLVKEFSSQQLQTVVSRMSALRSSALGGGASSDDTFGRTGRFSTFANYSLGFGTKDQTGFEDEADFTGHDLVGGLDYRFSSSLVAGAAAGYVRKDVKLSAEYDDGTVEADNARGRSEADGFGLTVFGQWETQSLYVGGSIGHQWLSYDMRRRADYLTSSDPDDAVPLTAEGSTDSSNLQASLSAGYVWNFGATSVDAAVSGLFQKSKTDGFEESGAVCPAGVCTGGGGPALDLNMTYDKQTIESLETSVSLRVSRAMTLGDLVLVPYLEGGFTRQMEDDRFRIRAMYTALYDIDDDGDVDIDYFSLDTDEIDKSYGAVSAGVTFVARNGLQGFLQYRRTVGLRDVSDNNIAVGVRLEL